jgi:hypothetical protein
MLEEKLSGIFRKGLLALGAAATLYAAGCDCPDPVVYRNRPMMQSSDESLGANEYILGETDDHQFYVTGECPEGCTPIPDSNCCECPND